MSDSGKKRRRLEGNRDLVLRISIGAAAVILLAGIIWIATSLISPKVDVTEGRSLLNKLNSAPVSTIKAEIKELEKKEAEELANRKNLPAATRFADTVIIGDGSVQGLIDYCALVRVLSVDEAGVSGVIETATKDLPVQSSKKTNTQTQPEKGAAEDDSDQEGDGVHNNYGIEGNQNTEQVYAGEELTMDTTYGNTEETTNNGGFESEETTVTIDQTINSQMITAIKANPSKLFLAYGFNDIEITNGDASTFVNSYRTVLEMLNEKLPECDIYVLSILPVRQNVIDQNRAYASLSDYNNQLAVLCRELHATFIDNTDLVAADDYLADGVTLAETFYYHLLARLEEIGDL